MRYGEDEFGAKWRLNVVMTRVTWGELSSSNFDHPKTILDLTISQNIFGVFASISSFASLNVGHQHNSRS